MIRTKSSKQRPNESCASDSDRSTKRPRCHIVSDESLSLNETGITNMLQGQVDEAENCFTRALHHLEGKSSDSTVESFKLATNSSFLIPRSNSLFAKHVVNVSKPLSSSSQCLEYDEGMNPFDEALPICNSTSEYIYSSTLRYNVGQTHLRRRQYHEAYRAFVLAERRLELFNDSESLMLKSMINHNKGYSLYRLGMLDEALTVFEKIRSASRNARLPEVYTAASSNAIAVILFHSISESTSDCMNLLQYSLSVYQKFYGNQSVQVATVLNNIGRVLFSQGKFASSLEAYENALLIRRLLLGSSSIDLAATICNAGQSHHRLGRYDSALSHYREFLKMAEELFPDHHRDIAMTLRCIAEVYHEQQNFTDAKCFYENALETGRLAGTDATSEVSTILFKLGNLYYETNKMDAALENYIESLFLNTEPSETFRQFKIVTLSNIAQIYRYQGKYSEALLTYTNIHKHLIEQYGPDCIEVANTLSNLGFVKFHLKDYAAAFKLYEESLKIQRRHYKGNKNKEIAATLSSMGLVSFSMGLLQVALECFYESLNIRKQILGNDHKDLAILWYNIATIYLEQGDEEAAIRYYKEALRVEKKSMKDYPKDVVVTLQHIGLVYQRRGELNAALEYFAEALEFQMHDVEGKNSLAIARLLNLIGNINFQKGSTGKMMDCYSIASRIYRQHPGESDATLVVAGQTCYGLSKLHPPCAPVA